MSKSQGIADLLREAEQSMRGSASARLDAELLLANVLRSDRTTLYAHPQRLVDADSVLRFQDMLSKRRDDYPVAYLLGEKEFWSLALAVNEDTLIPRPETECLVEKALEFIPPQQACHILDVGTGSGAIALAIASERPAATVQALDVSAAALKVARANAQRHGLANVEFIQSEWFAAVSGRRYDVILSNPPYVDRADSALLCSEIRYEPRLALDGGAGGLQAIATLIPQARQFLQSGGHIFIEHGYQQAAELKNLFMANDYFNIVCQQDYAGLDRFSFAQWP